MSADQFSLWLNNRHLMKELDDKTLKLKRKEIISFFGGFRAILINLCMNNQFTINLEQHQKLFKLLNTFKVEQKNRIKKSKTIKSTILETDIDETKKMKLTDIHDIGISNIFTFLSQNDHISFQNACKSFIVIGRRKESFMNDEDTHYYKHRKLCKQLSFQHKFNYLKTLIASNNDSIIYWSKALVCCTHFNWDRNIIASSGIIPLLFTLCHSTYDVDICMDILDALILENLKLKKISEPTLIKHGIFQLIISLLSIYYDHELIEVCIKIMNYLFKFNKSYINLWHKCDTITIMKRNFLRSSLCQFMVNNGSGKQIMNIYYSLLLYMHEQQWIVPNDANECCICSDRNKRIYAENTQCKVCKKIFSNKEKCFAILRRGIIKKRQSLKIAKVVNVFNKIMDSPRCAGLEEMVNFFPLFPKKSSNIIQAGRAVMEHIENAGNYKFGKMVLIEFEKSPLRILRLFTRILKSSIFGEYFKHIIMNYKCNITKRLIELCYSTDIQILMEAVECCLKLLSQYEQKWITLKIVYVFQEFIIQCKEISVNHQDRKKYRKLLNEIIGLLDKWRMRFDVVKTQISLDVSILQYITKNNLCDSQNTSEISKCSVWSNDGIYKIN